LGRTFCRGGLRPKIGELFGEARRRGLTTSLDTNDDPDGLWGDDVREALRYVDIFFPNEREAKSIAQTKDLTLAISRLSERVGIVAVQLGSEGAMVRKGAHEWRCSPLAVDVVDTVGAGDSFDAGFIRRFLQGAGVDECFAHANVAGAY
jgi:sugar/nucleoside kinase (ribokinase family)